MTLQLGNMTYHYHTTQQSHPKTKYFGCPAKNRVWTLSLEKLEPVDIWWSVTVGVDYIISYQ